jgi:hypothetical protein
VRGEGGGEEYIGRSRESKGWSVSGVFEKVDACMIVATVQQDKDGV